MLVRRMILKNVEVKTEDANPVFIYKLSSPDEHAEDAPVNYFPVTEIELLRNGWVRVSSYDDVPDELFPPWRVIALEGSL